jgi:hypothetical protein
MKKIKILANKFGVWWTLRFRNTLIREVELDAYKVVFRQYTMDVITKSGNFKMRTTLMPHPNGFLFNAIEQGDEKVVNWFCDRVYEFVSLITFDQGLIQDVNKAFSKFYKRMEKKAESIAKEVTPDEDKLNEEVVKANIEVAKMSKEEREAHKEVIREVLTNEEE